MQPDDEIFIPQDDLYVLAWEINPREFPNSTENNTTPTHTDAADASNNLGEEASTPGEIFTDVNLRSTGPHENGNFEPPKKILSESTNDWLDDHQLLGGSDTTVPE